MSLITYYLLLSYQVERKKQKKAEKKTLRIKRVSRLLTNMKLAKIRAENEAQKAEAAVKAAIQAAPELAAVVEAPHADPPCGRVGERREEIGRGH